MLSPAVTRWSTLVLAVVASFAALKVGQTVFAPLMLAFVIGIVLSPLSDACERAGAPRLLATLVAMAVGLSLIVALALLLQPLVWRVADLAPAIWRQFAERLSEIETLIGGFGAVGEEVAAVVDADASAGSDEPVLLPTLTDALLLAPTVAGQILTFIGGLFFFLLGRVEVYDALSRHRGPSGQSRDGTRILLTAERRVSRYFLTILCINAVFGVIVAGAMALVGMPWPLTWGIVAFLLNFILYLGPVIMATSLVAAGAMNAPGIEALVPAAVYVALNATEGQLVTPSLVGRSLHVNPLLVFLSLVVWLWLWGPLGGFIAIPLLVWVIAVATGFRGEREAVGGAAAVPDPASHPAPAAPEAPPPSRRAAPGRMTPEGLPPERLPAE